MKTRTEIEAMSPEERRIKTAELCGWVIRQIHLDEDTPDVICFPPGIESTDQNVFECAGNHPPDYLASLDAMHEAEKLPAISRLSDEWVEALRVVVAADAGLPREIAEGEPIEQTVKFILRLSAKQRNTAFLMVLL